MNLYLVLALAAVLCGGGWWVTDLRGDLALCQANAKLQNAGVKQTAATGQATVQAGQQALVEARAKGQAQQFKIEALAADIAKPKAKDCATAVDEIRKDLQ